MIIDTYVNRIVERKFGPRENFSFLSEVDTSEDQ